MHDSDRAITAQNCVKTVSLLAAGNAHWDYEDAITASVSLTRTTTVDEAAWLFFGRSPRWIEALMRLRNALVRPFGLQTSAGTSPRPLARYEIGSDALLFHVVDRNERELVMAETDSHLEFKTSVLLEELGGHRIALTSSTVVRYHNLFGRIYFFFVRPFHRLIVRATLREVVKALTTGDPPPDARNV